MANINVMDAVTGQIQVKDTSLVTVSDIQDIVMQTTLPTGDFDHLIRVPAANGMVKTASISHTALISDAIAAVNTARANIVAWVQTQIDALSAGKFDKPTGTTSQVVLGDGTLGALPTPVNISGKSDKANFTALSTLAVNGQSAGSTNSATNAVTTNPTNSPTDAPTNYGVLAAILGADANTTNAKQNITAANVNTLATNVNSLSTKYNDLATKYNDLATRFNAILTWLGTTTTTGLTGSVNGLRVAGAT